MNNSFARLVEGMCHQLLHEVLPRVDDAYARSQLWGVINALNTFGLRADWSPALLLQQIEHQQRALTAVRELLPDAPELPAAPGMVADTAALLGLREQGNLAINECLRRLADPALPAEHAARAAALLRAAMRGEVELELQHSPRPLFAQMSGSAGG